MKAHHFKLWEKSIRKVFVTIRLISSLSHLENFIKTLTNLFYASSFPPKSFSSPKRSKKFFPHFLYFFKLQKGRKRSFQGLSKIFEIQSVNKRNIILNNILKMSLSGEKLFSLFFSFTFTVFRKLV